jgi:hypothetical protein
MQILGPLDRDDLTGEATALSEDDWSDRCSAGEGLRTYLRWRAKVVRIRLTAPKRENAHEARESGRLHAPSVVIAIAP